MDNSHWDKEEPERKHDRRLIVGIVVSSITAFLAPPSFVLSYVLSFRFGIILVIDIVFLIVMSAVGATYIWNSDNELITKLKWTFFPMIAFVVSCLVFFSNFKGVLF